MEMRIGIDIDGVMYQWDRTARYMLRNVLPGSPYGFLVEESKSWNEIQHRVAPEDWGWLWNEGVKLGLFRYGHMYPGTVQAIRKLATMGEIVLITHRPTAAVKDTLAWLAYNDFPISELHLLTAGENKASVKPECDIYLDDKPENCIDLADGTKARIYLMARPWNYGFRDAWSSSYPGIHTIENWNQFIEEISHVRT